MVSLNMPRSLDLEWTDNKEKKEEDEEETD